MMILYGLITFFAIALAISFALGRTRVNQRTRQLGDDPTRELPGARNSQR